jgi:hypothetical protein
MSSARAEESSEEAGAPGGSEAAGLLACGLELEAEVLVLGLDGAEGDHEAVVLAADRLELGAAGLGLALDPVEESSRAALDDPGDLELAAGGVELSAGGVDRARELLDTELVGALEPAGAGDAEARAGGDDFEHGFHVW